MKIRIYQINRYRDMNRLSFIGTKNLKKYFGITEIDSSLYDLIYENDVDCRTLEDIFEMFNIHRPSDFRGWSMSTSDVVEIIESEEIAKGFYFCDSFGFTRISFDSTLCETR